MGHRITRAVQLYSKYRVSSESSDFYLFTVLLEIASRADNITGVCGIEGSKDTCYSARGMAEATGISRNTVNRCIAKLEKGGELTLLAKGGRGGGYWRVWRVELPFDLIPFKSKDSTTGDRKRRNTPVPLGQEMAQASEKIAQAVESAITPEKMAQAMALAMAYDPKRWHTGWRTTPQKMAHGMAHENEKMAHEDGIDGAPLWGTPVSKVSKVSLVPLVSKTPLTPQGGNEVGNEETNPLMQLVLFFSEQTGKRVPNDLSAERNRKNWLEPFVDIYHACDSDFEFTEFSISEAIREMDIKNLTIATPRSIVSVALRLARQSKLSDDEVFGEPLQGNELAYAQYLQGRDQQEGEL